MKITVEGTQEEIKEILSAICNNREDNKTISIDNLNRVIVNPFFQEKLQKFDRRKRLKMGL